MQKIVKNIICELTEYRANSVDVSTGDRMIRSVACWLMENSKPWTVPADAWVQIAYKLPNGTTGIYDTMPDGTPAAGISGNAVIIELLDRLASQEGVAELSIVLTGSAGEQLATWPIQVQVIGAQKLTIPENLPALGARFEERLLYGGLGGALGPLKLGEGLVIRDGVISANGNTGIQGPQGEPGYTPVRGTDYWTTADQEAIVQQVIAALGTPVFGRVDGDNNIILTGELVDGTYTIKYEDADDNVTTIGTYTKVTAPKYTNVLPLATDKTGAVYNGTGYKVGARIGSSGTEGTVSNPSASNPIFLTGYIKVPAGATIRMKNCFIDTNGSTNNYNADADKAYYGHDVGGLYGCMVYTNLNQGSWDTASNYQWNIFENFSFLASTPSVDDNGYITEFTLNTTTEKYIRMHLGGDPTTAIITVNEPITD